jgi:phosphoribosylglycinamide formyltransferase-1
MNIAFFASHRGSNMQAVLDAWSAGKLDVSPRLLISNNRKSEALVRAEAAGLATAVCNGVTHPEPDDLDQAILQLLIEHRIELIVLAGYMKLLGPKVVARFRNRILNIHPALLPNYGGTGMYGMRVHEAVIAAGDTETGVTVHLVDEKYDEGEIVAQTRVAVLPSDTPATLAARVLIREHEFLPEVLAGIRNEQILLPR